MAREQPLAGALGRLFGARAMRLRRSVLEAMLRETGVLAVDKPLARLLGTRTRILRRDIDRMIADGATFDWLDEHRDGLVQRVHHVVTLGLSDDELTSLISALRRSTVSGSTLSDIRDSTLVLADVLRQTFPNTRGLAPFGGMGRADDAQPPGTSAGMTAAQADAVIAVTQAMKKWRKLRIHYTAADQSRSERVVWPLTTTNHGSTLVAWCELRDGFRHFRLDQIAAPHLTADPIPRLREDLMRAWRSETGSPEKDAPA